LSPSSSTARIDSSATLPSRAPDGKSFFYSALDENHRPSKVFHNILGQPQSEDRLVYEEPAAGLFMGVGGSLLDDFIYIDIP
ncbi:S9 family peptidase, partial [Rhizobium ruizarguesonis]